MFRVNSDRDILNDSSATSDIRIYSNSCFIHLERGSGVDLHDLLCKGRPQNSSLRLHIIFTFCAYIYIYI